MEPHLVSVIVPAYQAEVFLAETLDHVSTQTYREWELIVVEDGPPGSAETIVQEFSRKHPSHRVVYRRHDRNLGQGSARNTALAEARGQYMALLDADDIWLPTHLQASVDSLRRTTCLAAYSTAVCFHSDTRQLQMLWGPTAAETASFPRGLFHRNFITPSTVVMARSVFEKVGLFETSPELQGCEDIDYWLRCAAAAIPFVCIPGCHVLYRKAHAQAATSRMDRISIRHAKVLERHLGMPLIPRHTQRREVARHYRLAGILNVRRKPRQAAALLWHAWSFARLRVDCCLLALLAWSLALVHREEA